MHLATRVTTTCVMVLVACGAPGPDAPPTTKTQDVTVAALPAPPSSLPPASSSAPRVDGPPAANGLASGADCNPARDTCADGLRCDSTCQSDTPRFACGAAQIGDVPHGGRCTDTLRCRRNARCVYTSDEEAGRCVAYCAADRDCPAPTRCQPSVTYCDTADSDRTIEYRECK